MRRLVPLFILVLLPGCQTSYEGNEDSPFYAIPAGSSVTLTRNLTVPANQVAVFLQGGEVVPSDRVNQYYPHCKFELRRRLDTPQTVQADSFQVTKVVQEIGHSVALEQLRLAEVSIGMGFLAGARGDGASLQTWSTRMMLSSAHQPDVFRLSCGQAALLHEGQHVSINEMRKALGGIFALKLPPRRPT